MKSNVSGNPLDDALLEHGVLTLSSDDGPMLRIHVDDITAVISDDEESKTVIITAGGVRLYVDGLDVDAVAARWLDALRAEREEDRLRRIGVELNVPRAGRVRNR